MAQVYLIKRKRKSTIVAAKSADRAPRSGRSPKKFVSQQRRPRISSQKMGFLRAVGLERFRVSKLKPNLKMAEQRFGAHAEQKSRSRNDSIVSGRKTTPPRQGAHYGSRRRRGRGRGDAADEGAATPDRSSAETSGRGAAAVARGASPRGSGATHRRGPGATHTTQASSTRKRPTSSRRRSATSPRSCETARRRRRGSAWSTSSAWTLPSRPTSC